MYQVEVNIHEHTPGKGVSRIHKKLQQLNGKTNSENIKWAKAFTKENMKLANELTKRKRCSTSLAI